MMQNDDYLVQQAKLLARRLERISPDSLWARRSSGHRGALLRWVEWIEAKAASADGASDGQWQSDLKRLESLIEDSYQFLEKAIQEYLLKK